MKVFIDTGAFIAYFLKQEESHDEVVRKYNFYSEAKATFITSDYIIDELLTWFSAKQPKHHLEKLIDALDKMEKDGELGFVHIDKTIFRKAREILLKFSDHKISFTDATTYVLYKDFSLDEVFTLDRDFKKMRITTSF
ncbi:MAG: type II toxin-antitoxin system VapC family toxin [Candidatus Levybacteria bacterium]|nr:type II toxin-antitoxin system VapC family toxin [Candidatus Levybacteria bacterium]